MRLKTGMTSAIYTKSLRLSPRSQAAEGVGNILTLMSNDVQKILDSFAFLLMGAFAPYQILLITVVLLIMLGPYGLLPLGVTFVMLPITAGVAKRFVYVRAVQIKQTVARTELTDEFLEGIRAVKYYAWEIPYVRAINSKRENELLGVRRYLRLQAVLFTMLNLNPILATVVTLVVFRAGTGSLPIDTAFATVSRPLSPRWPLSRCCVFHWRCFPFS
jgi:ABC-type bacteriocin/lantibiotic exporter with double-glycine peptidase domain